MPPARCGATACRPVAPGDRLTRPLYVLPDGGDVAVRTTGGGPSPDEPGVQRYSVEGDEGIWIEYVALVASDVQVTCPVDYAMILEAFAGQTVPELALIATSEDGVLTFAASPGMVFMVRVRPAVPHDMRETADVTFTVTDRVAPVIIFATDVQQAPGTLRVTITNGDPGATVTLSVDGYTVATSQDVVLDDTGSLISQAIFIDEALVAAVYTLRAVHTGRPDATDTFNVVLDPEEVPTELPADAVPAAVAQVGPRRFVLQDPAPGGDEYVLPRNPTSMTSPFPDNVLSTDVTTAPDGQILTWEGARQVKEWSWSGYLDTEEQLETMLAFQQLNHRFFVLDHRNRAWVVSFESFDPEPVRNVDVPWAHSYKATLFIYDGPLEPV